MGALRGTLKKLPSEDSPDLNDGILEYEKDGVNSEVSFSLSDVNEYVTSLAVGDQVSCPQAALHIPNAQVNGIVSPECL